MAERVSHPVGQRKISYFEFSEVQAEVAIRETTQIRIFATLCVRINSFCLD